MVFDQCRNLRLIDSQVVSWFSSIFRRRESALHGSERNFRMTLSAHGDSFRLSGDGSGEPFDWAARATASIVFDHQH
jgi:hypothetical protein